MKENDNQHAWQKCSSDKAQYNFKRTTAIVSLKNSKLIDKYDYVTIKEIKPPDQLLVHERRKLEYTPLTQKSINDRKNNLEQGKKPFETTRKIVCYNKR